MRKRRKEASPSLQCTLPMPIWPPIFSWWSMEQLATGQTDFSRHLTGFSTNLTGFSRQLTDATEQLTALLDRQDDLQSDVGDRGEVMSMKSVVHKEEPADHHRKPDYPASIVVSRLATAAFSRHSTISEKARNTRSLRWFSGEVPTLRLSQGPWSCLLELI